MVEQLIQRIGFRLRQKSTQPAEQTVVQPDNSGILAEIFLGEDGGTFCHDSLPTHMSRARWLRSLERNLRREGRSLI